LDFLSWCYFWRGHWRDSLAELQNGCPWGQSQLLHRGATLLQLGEVVSQLSHLGNLAALAPGGNSLTTGGSRLAALAPGGNRLAALAPRGSCDGAGRATCQILPQYCHILPTLRLARLLLAP
jgi:hypothetical protein